MSRFFFDTANARDVETVVRAMRPADRREVMAVRFSDRVEDLVDDLTRALPHAIRCFVLGRDGAPVAIVGAWLTSPGVATVLMIATDDWPAIAGPATRWVRKVAIPAVLGRTVRRAECKCWSEHAVSRRWLKRLGFVEEGRVRGLGRGGEDFVQLAWLNPVPPPLTETIPCASAP